MLYILGIDNGYNGAIAILNERREVIIHDMPVVTEIRTKGKKKTTRQHYDKYAMITMLRNYTHPDSLPESLKKESLVTPEDQVFIFLEQAHPMKGKIGGGNGSPQGNFRTGFGSGLWQMGLTANQISYQEVHSKTWQTTFFKGIMGADTKQKSFAVANQLYPRYAELFRGPRGAVKDGRTDALLIAEYGLRQVLGGALPTQQTETELDEDDD